MTCRFVSSITLHRSPIELSSAMSSKVSITSYAVGGFATVSANIFGRILNRLVLTRCFVCERATARAVHCNQTLHVQPHAAKLEPYFTLAYC
jgi:hypothetical protein